VSLSCAYDAAAGGWADGPARLYDALAEAMLRDVRVSGTALDVGAGTGVAARAALRRGASRAVVCDVSPAMLRRAGLPAVVADAARLPFADGAFDLATAACLLGHLDEPETALREMARVAGMLAASAFRTGWTHPVKTVVDDLLARAGYTTPGWYRRLKRVGEPAVGDAARLAALAHRAGLPGVTVEQRSVETGLCEPADLVDWRLGMAHVAPFVAALPPEYRIRLRAQAEAALAGCPPLVVPLLVLTARAPRR
jgi:SAM-dependent methyltransferase